MPQSRRARSRGRRDQHGTNRVLIVCPAHAGSKSGNRVRALRYQRILKQLGLFPQIHSDFRPGYDILVALHAVKSAAAIQAAKAQCPQLPLVVVITGTDLYRTQSSNLLHRSLRLADRIVVSLPTLRSDLANQFRAKCDVIYPSAPPPTNVREETFLPRKKNAVVCGHLRSVKDPFRVALAVRNLPGESQIRVDHFGAALQESMAQRAEKEMAHNPRYRWHGELPRWRVRQKLARAWLMVLSSRVEGGSNALAEALAANTPVLATKIPGNVGLLGEDYPGLFEVGNTKELRALLVRCESDDSYYRQLIEAVRPRAALVDQNRELASWKDLLRQLDFC